MTDPPLSNGILSRIAVLESAHRAMREDIRDLRTEDIGEIKVEVKQLRAEFQASRQGMTRGEKIALSAVGVTLIMAIIAAIALIQTAPTP